jgi:hypothetical protein
MLVAASDKGLRLTQGCDVFVVEQETGDGGRAQRARARAQPRAKGDGEKGVVLEVGGAWSGRVWRWRSLGGAQG